MPKKLTLAILMLMLTGCALPIQYIRSKPSYSEITINSRLSTLPFYVAQLDLPGDSFRGTAILPSGKYTPLYEDEKGYYYHAEGKLQFDGTTGGLLPVLTSNGGLYLEKNKKQPEEMYFLTGQGFLIKGPLDKQFSGFTLKP